MCEREDGRVLTIQPSHRNASLPVGSGRGIVKIAQSSLTVIPYAASEVHRFFGRREAARPARADGEAAGGAVDFHFSDIPVRGDDGARAIGANDDAAAVELRGRRRQHP